MEKDIERAVCSYAESRGLLQRKFTTPGRRNAPDRIFFAPTGTVFMIEFKDTGKKPNAGQLREASIYRDFGLDVFFVDSITGGRAVVDSYT